MWFPYLVLFYTVLLVNTINAVSHGQDEGGSPAGALHHWRRFDNTTRPVVPQKSTSIIDIQEPETTISTRAKSTLAAVTTEEARSSSISEALSTSLIPSHVESPSSSVSISPRTTASPTDSPRETRTPADTTQPGSSVTSEAEKPVSTVQIPSNSPSGAASQVKITSPMVHSTVNSMGGPSSSQVREPSYSAAPEPSTQSPSNVLSSAVPISSAANPSLSALPPKQSSPVQQTSSALTPGISNSVKPEPSEVSASRSDIEQPSTQTPSSTDSPVPSVTESGAGSAKVSNQVSTNKVGESQVPPMPTMPGISSLASEIRSILDPSNVGGQVSSLLSEVLSLSLGGPATNIPVPTSPLASWVSSILSDRPQPTGFVSTGLSVINPSTLIPTQETLALPTRSVSVSASGADPVPTLGASLGISFPGASGTGSSASLGASASSSDGLILSSMVVKSQATETVPVESNSAVVPSGSITASISGTTSEPSPVQFSIFSTADPTAVFATTDSASGLVSTQTPNSSQQTPLSLPSHPGSVSGAFGSANATTTKEQNVPSMSASVADTLVTMSGVPPVSSSLLVADGSSTTGPVPLSSGTDLPGSTLGSADPSASSSRVTDASSGGSASPTGLTTLPSGATETVPTGFPYSRTITAAASSTTAAAGGGENPKPAPLSKSQTAGVVIGGATVVVIALVASLFLIGRYRNNMEKRHSKESVYPKSAYLYDPAGYRDDDAEAGEAGRAPPMMSGGAGGYRPLSLHSSHRHSQASSRHSNPFHDPPPSPAPSRMNGYGGTEMNEAAGKYKSLMINPYAFAPVAQEYPPMSPYGPPTRHLPAVPKRVSEHSNHFTDDAYLEQQDLLLSVDMRSETPDHAMLTAPPPSPHPYGRYTPPPFGHNNSAASSPRIPQPRTDSPSRPPPGVINKGWDDIKLDDELPMPPPLPLAPTPRKPIPQRQHQRSNSGAVQMLLSGPGLPLTVKRDAPGSKPPQNRGLGLEAPNMGHGSPRKSLHIDPVLKQKASREFEWAVTPIGKSF